MSREIERAVDELVEYEGEKFQFGHRTYDVHKAVQYIASNFRTLEREDVSIKDLMGARAFVTIDPEHAKDATSGRSGIIVVDEFDGQQMGLLIDGWHRLWNLDQQGIETMSCWIIDDPEAVEAIRV